MGGICGDNKTVRKKIIEINTQDSCYKSKAEIIQRPEIGKDDFVIKISAEHKGDHSCDEQILLLIFNYPVNFIKCSGGGNLISSNNTSRIRVKLNFHNNPNDKIEIDDFSIKCSQQDLEIVSCTINDNH